MFLKHQRVTVILATILTAVLVNGCGSPPAEVMAEVNGTKITRPEVEAHMNLSRLFDPSIEPMFEDEQSREYLVSHHLDELIYFELLNQFAADLGVEVTAAEKEEHFQEMRLELLTLFDSESDMKSRMEKLNLKEAHIRVPVNSWLVYDKILELMSADVSDEEVSALMAEDPRAGVNLTLSHILTKTKEEAQAARERILKGESFADVAKDVSQDGSAAEGGNLGMYAADTDRLLPEFMTAANALAVNELSEPVQSFYGWHLILVTERTGPNREVVKESMAARLVTDKFMAFHEDAQIIYHTESAPAS